MYGREVSMGGGIKMSRKQQERMDLKSGVEFIFSECIII